MTKFKFSVGPWNVHTGADSYGPDTRADIPIEEKFKKFAFMNKAELISAIADNSGLSKVDSKKALDGFIAAVSNALKSGDKVALVGFGSFDVAERSARTGVNPATGAKIKIDAKKVVKFKAGAELADLVK